MAFTRYLWRNEGVPGVLGCLGKAEGTLLALIWAHLQNDLKQNWTSHHNFPHFHNLHPMDPVAFLVLLVRDCDRYNLELSPYEANHELQ